MITNMPLAVQSYCFRNFPSNDETAGLVRSLGISAVELCGVHVNFRNPAVYDAVIDSYRSKGVTIVSTGVNGISGDAAIDRGFFEFSKRCGATCMSVNFELSNLDARLTIAEKLAEEYDVRLAIHNHGGAHWLGNREAIRWVFSKTSPRIGLNLDTAWALDAGEDPIGMITEFKDRLYSLHLKDFVFDRARARTDVVFGAGNISLDAMGRVLDEINFSGIAVVEYEGDAANPVPALKQCVESICARIPFRR